jgi:putative hydrolase of the HAD superfamily
MQPAKPILFFDFGNVVGYFDYLILCGRFGRRVGRSAEEFRDQIVARGFANLLDEFERGALPPEAFAAKVCELGEVEIPYHEFVPDWSDIFQANEEIADLIGVLKSKGYSLYLGSNTNFLHADHYRRQFASTLDLMDGLVLSYEVGHIKPAAEFFLACSKLAGADPGSCVFIDDVEANVEGARASGFMGLHYRDTASLVRELREIGVDLPA